MDCTPRQRFAYRENGRVQVPSRFSWFNPVLASSEQLRLDPGKNRSDTSNRFHYADDDLTVDYEVFDAEQRQEVESGFLTPWRSMGIALVCRPGLRRRSMAATQECPSRQDIKDPRATVISPKVSEVLTTNPLKSLANKHDKHIVIICSCVAKHSRGRN